MTGPISRIILRYGVGAMVAYGLIEADLGNQIAVDPDLIAMVGLGIGAMVEGGYVLAKRKGWAT
jgi:hypothetical protein